MSETLERGGGSGSHRLVRSSAAALSVAGTSQFLGLVQLALLLRGGAGRPTDIYFFITAWTTAPIQLFLVSTFYPLLLKFGATESREQRKWVVITCGAIFGSALAGGAIYSAKNGYESDLAPIAGLSALSSTVSVWAWQRALVLSAHGRPRWISGINLLPSLFVVPILAIPAITDQTDRVCLLLVGQLVGFLAYGFLTKSASGGMSPIGERSASEGLGHARRLFLAQSGSAYGSLLVIQSVGIGLPAAEFTVFATIGRVVAGLNSLISSAVLPLLINHSTRRSDTAVKFCWLLLVGVGLAAGLSDSLIAGGMAPSLRAHRHAILIGLVWIAAVSLNATLHRVAFRFHHAGLSWITVLVSPAVALISVFIGFSGISLNALLWCTVAIDLISAVAFSFALRKYALAVGICLSTAVIALM